MQSLALIEGHGWAASMAVLDAAEKAADVVLEQVELNDLLGACMKLRGDSAAVNTSVSAAIEMARRLKASCVAKALLSPDQKAWKVIEAPPEFSPLMECNVVFSPKKPSLASTEKPVNGNGSFALGLIETQGLTAVLEAIDAACKAASVEVVGREKLGGGYVTVIIKGDVAAVKAAIEAGKSRVDGLGKLIAAHVIARPSEGVLGLLPK
jgi:microcompartment protein CcmL/EutN